MSFLLVVTFYRVILNLKCAIVMGSFAIHCDSMRVMSSSSIHGSALLGVLLLHLRYVGIKLPPAVFFVLKGGKNPQPRLLNVSERAHLYPQAQFQVPNFLLFPSCCFLSTSSPGPQKRAWSCTAFFQLPMALQCWIDLCAKVPLIRSFYLCLHLWLQSICFFLSHEV